MADTTRNYLIGFVIFTALILSGITMINIFRDDISGYADSDQLTAFNETFNRYSDLNESASELQNRARFPTFEELIDASFKLTSNTANLIIIGVNGITYIVEGFTFITDSVLGLSLIIPGFPAWASGLIVLAIIIIFALVIIKASLNRDL